MASAYNSSGYVEKLSQWYGEDVLAVEQGFPGIFEPAVGKHELEGEVDLLVREEERKLRAYEIKEAGSLTQENALQLALDAKKQCDNIEEYFEDLGYEIGANYIVAPVDHLKAVYELWDSLPDVFELEDAKEMLSEPGRIGYLEENALERKEDEMYTIDDSLTALFETEIVQP